jgi:hypothetical protein
MNRTVRIGVEIDVRHHRQRCLRPPPLGIADLGPVWVPVTDPGGSERAWSSNYVGRKA